jgi:hypothetical protein
MKFISTNEAPITINEILEMVNLLVDTHEIVSLKDMMLLGNPLASRPYF